MTENPFRQTFSNQHVILPVIHVESQDQAFRNVLFAREAGCDGAFLINHTHSYLDLIRIYRNVSEAFPGWWLGLNCLDLTPNQVFHAVPKNVSGIWVDNAGIDELSENQTEAEEILSQRVASGWRGLYFGGIAFKYSRKVEDLERATRLGLKYMDVITTSGKGTGRAAEIEKISRMKQAAGDFPLAIASGITPDNVDSYLELADCFLVATGISRSWSELDPKLVQKLVERVRNYKPGE